VGTARSFQPPLYIHICPLAPVVVRHSSRRPLHRRREKRAILRSCNCRVAFARRCVEFVCLSRRVVRKKCARRHLPPCCMSLCPWACVKVGLFVYTFRCL